MLIPQRARRGLGDTAYHQGVEFNCTADICYAIGADRHQLFQTLQQQINFFATPAGFRAVGQDGFLGQDTLAAAIQAARFIATLPDAPNNEAFDTLTEGSATKETLAANAPLLLTLFASQHATLDAARATAGLPPLTAPLITNTSPTAMITTAANASPIKKVAAKLKSGDKATWAWTIAGVLVGAAAIGGGVWAYRRHLEGV